MPPATTLPGPNGMWAHPYGGELGPIAYDHDKSPAEQQEQRNDWYAEQRESGISVSDLFLVLGRSAADGILTANSSRWRLDYEMSLTGSNQWYTLWLNPQDDMAGMVGEVDMVERIIGWGRLNELRW